MAPSSGYLSITLHAHLPYVVNHGTWPHGLEWLHEAAAESYLPLLRMLRRLEADGISPCFNIDFSPVLLEQLAHPVFLGEFPNYLSRKLQYAREDEAFFEQASEVHFASVARFWQRIYAEAASDFENMHGNLLGEFRRIADAGHVDLLTCSATHGYNPLLGTDESVRAQVRVAVQTHRHHFGRVPKGIWLPECGYRPAGYWQPPISTEGEERPLPGFHRIGVEQALAESGLEFFFVDGHLIHGSNRFAPFSRGTDAENETAIQESAPGDGKLYHPYAVEGAESVSSTAVFPRDPRTGFHVWSGTSGYPADPAYLDFHKKRWPGGHRYWRVTGPEADLADKLPYHPEDAMERTRAHAKHFVGIVEKALQQATITQAPPVLSAPFDAELFGHWWFEGVFFLEHVARLIAGQENAVGSITAHSYLQRYPAEEAIRMPEGSWGAGGDNRVWLNSETSWTYQRIYSCEQELREFCTEGDWRDGGLRERILKQMCRELLLLEASDWQFLITTGAARDYAERRFREHSECFDQLRALWYDAHGDGNFSSEQVAQLERIESLDSLFSEVNPEFWVRGAHEDGSLSIL